ncbi:MAG: BPSS1780 family membrane protein [Burkholderiales bacterium]
MADMNPYKAPDAAVADVATGQGGDAVSVPAGNGWQWIADAFALFKQQPALWIGVTIVFFLMLIVLQIIPVIGALGAYLLAPVLAGGLMLGCRAQERGEGLTFNHLFAGFSTNTSNLVVVGVLMLVAIVIAVAIVLIIFGAGMLALFMGGGSKAVTGGSISIMTVMLAALVMVGLSVPIYMAVWFAPALVVFRGLSAVEAMKASFGACLKNIVPFIVYSVVVFVLGIIATIPVGLGWFVLGPILVIAVYTTYKDIFQE